MNEIAEPCAQDDMLKAPYRQAAQDLLDGKGYGRVPFGVPPVEIVDTIVGPFHQLIGQPEDEREKWCFDFSGEKKRPDHGLVRRGSLAENDLKHFFHQRPWADLDHDLERLLKIRGVDFKPHEYWFACMQAICEQALDAIKQVAEALDSLAPELSDNRGFQKSLAAEAAMRQHVLRLLEYDAKPKANDLADDHFDYSYLTLAGMCETASGLWLGNKSNLYHAEPGWAIVFPGRKMHAFTDGQIPATLHGVLSPSEAVTRNAVVFFSHIDGPRGPAYEAAKA